MSELSQNSPLVITMRAIGSITMPYGSNLATLSSDQPILQFSPTPVFGALNSQPSRAQVQRLSVVSSDPVTTDTSTLRLFDEFTSTFPSIDPSFKSSQEP
ncbi:hypothetical protein BBP40_011061 [Aspergillus hancockii]|nr:hypothetical protein BBP40_011061 [Aspergillus hancockii]